MQNKLLVTAGLFSVAVSLFAQEALKSTEEEYYDFLSLSGITRRPTLGYRTLSDSQWQFVEKENPLFDENGNPLLDEKGNPVTEKTLPEHVWQNNNLGRKRTLWQSENKGENWFTRGFDHSIKFKAYGPEWYNSFNTNSPYGQNDGGLWQGKGYNSSLTGGARLEAYGFELTIKPQLCFSQNLGFDIMPNHAYDSEYSYFQPGIDLPQRFGDKPFWTFDWGDTEIRWTWHNFTIGFGSQSPWLGPAWLNPMLGSNNAASYPKFDLGLRKTSVYLPKLGWHIGDIEGRIWVGRLEESDYFDNNPDNKYRMLNALSLSFSPGFIPGLTVGVNRVFITPWEAKYLTLLPKLVSSSDSNTEKEDGKISFFIDWNFSKVGFEVYTEIGKDDYSRWLRNFEHTLIYTVGMKKTIPIYKNFVRGKLYVEWSNFEMTQDFQTQWQYTGWFSHGSITQGYTNKGQVLSAGSGTFGNSLYIGFQTYYPKGMTNIFLHRYRPDDNYVSNQAVYTSATENNYWHDSWKCIFAVGTTTTHFFTNALSITGTLCFQRIYNELYIYGDRFGQNWFFSLKAHYTF